ncbi:MAG: OmpA family protein [Bacteroidales bacterium]|nr:OmpA family protein [Bacteroidales bacterium]
MKHFLICTIIAVSVSVAAGAQQATAQSVQSQPEIESDSTLMMSSKFSKNWEFNAGIGIQAYLAEYSRLNSQFRFKDWWSPALDLGITKWASPYFGLGLGFTAAQMKNGYMDGDKTAIFAKADDPAYTGSLDASGNPWLHVYSGYYGNFFAKAAFNATNILFGFNPDRKVELTGYLGGGLVFPLSEVNYKSRGSSFNAGLALQFRVAKHTLVNLGVRGSLISDDFNGIDYVASGDKKNIPLDGTIGATLGLSYKFGYVNRKNIKTGKVSEYDWVPAIDAYESSEYVAGIVKESSDNVAAAKDAVIADMTGMVAAGQSEISKLQKENEQMASVIAEKKDFWIHIAFDIDKWDISNNEKVDILAAANYIKSCPRETFVIRGYADMQTASPKHNEMLSHKRADAVRDCLVNDFGVDPTQLEVDYYGGVDYMFFSDEECSRSVIISNR